MQQSNMETGQLGENLVLEHYYANGYSLIAKNFQYYSKNTQGRQGEIDLILEKDKVLHLVEVKARNNQAFGSVYSSISRQKLLHLYYTYQYFLSKKDFQMYRQYLVQFDLATVYQGKVDIVYNAYSFDLLSGR